MKDALKTFVVAFAYITGIITAVYVTPTVLNKASNMFTTKTKLKDM